MFWSITVLQHQKLEGWNCIYNGKPIKYVLWLLENSAVLEGKIKKRKQEKWWRWLNINNLIVPIVFESLWKQGKIRDMEVSRKQAQEYF